MDENKNRLSYIDGETLMDMRLEPTKFCVETLFPQGICILGGAPKIGKSWMVLDLCVRIAKGEEVWNLKTKKGSTLYLCLEDSYARIQQRLNCITDEVPNNIFFSVCAKTMAEGLCEQIKDFVAEHPDTVLVAIDTFQIIRKSDSEISYGNDYQEIRVLKSLADELGITLLLVNHLRKQGDSDPLNKLSGSTGISGAVDAVFVLDVSKRNQNSGTLICTGRDIGYRELELRLGQEKFVWELISDSMDSPEILLPKEMTALIKFAKSIINFNGSNSDFGKQYNRFSGYELSAKALKQMMNKYRYYLEDSGVFFESTRSNGGRFVKVSFSSVSDVSDSSDETLSVPKTCVPFVTCDPVAVT